MSRRMRVAIKTSLARLSTHLVSLYGVTCWWYVSCHGGLDNTWASPCVQGSVLRIAIAAAFALWQWSEPSWSRCLMRSAMRLQRQIQPAWLGS